MYELIRHYFREVCKHLAKARLLASSKSLGEGGGLGGGGLGGRGFNDDEKKKFLITVFPRISAHTLGHNVKQAPPSNNRPPLFPNFLN